MIVYDPLNGHPLQSGSPYQARHCFLMTKLGDQMPPMVDKIRAAVVKRCRVHRITVIDALESVTGRDILLKIWELIASSPISVAILHEDFPHSTQTNIFFELGVAQALGKETVIIKSPGAPVPSDLIRTEYIEFGGGFDTKFDRFLKSVFKRADHYVRISETVENDPVLALDYLKRAFLISGNEDLRQNAASIIESEGFERRSASSVERQAASF